MSVKIETRLADTWGTAGRVSICYKSFTNTCPLW